ncbi:hypothetical protein [Bifidobacterium callimiconis]|uniref:hypothetical protein n=1 Tax=Bifidobacterium callimiconis TaxID=2306973 RepID=UPI001F0AE746|nr:hypothetical protein [Bifidobacterium callimiconis]
MPDPEDERGSARRAVPAGEKLGGTVASVAGDVGAAVFARLGVCLRGWKDWGCSAAG